MDAHGLPSYHDHDAMMQVFNVLFIGGDDGILFANGNGGIAPSSGAILQEDGSFILQEDSSFILQES